MCSFCSVGNLNLTLLAWFNDQISELQSQNEPWAPKSAPVCCNLAAWFHFGLWLIWRFVQVNKLMKLRAETVLYSGCDPDFLQLLQTSSWCHYLGFPQILIVMFKHIYLLPENQIRVEISQKVDSLIVLSMPPGNQSLGAIVAVVTHVWIGYSWKWDS